MRKETVIKQRRLFTEGRRFISEDRKEGDVYDTLHLGKIKCCIPIFHTQTYIKKTATYQNSNGGRSHFGPGVHDELLLMCLFVCFLSETRSQNTEKMSVDQAATILLNFLQQAREGGEGRSNSSRSNSNNRRCWKHKIFKIIIRYKKKNERQESYLCSPTTGHLKTHFH